MGEDVGEEKDRVAHRPCDLELNEPKSLAEYKCQE